MDGAAFPFCKVTVRQWSRWPCPLILLAFAEVAIPVCLFCCHLLGQLSVWFVSQSFVGAALLVCVFHCCLSGQLSSCACSTVVCHLLVPLSLSCSLSCVGAAFLISLSFLGAAFPVYFTTVWTAFPVYFTVVCWGSIPSLFIFLLFVRAAFRFIL